MKGYTGMTALGRCLNLRLQRARPFYGSGESERPQPLSLRAAVKAIENPSAIDFSWQISFYALPLPSPAPLLS